MSRTIREGLLEMGPENKSVKGTVYEIRVAGRMPERWFDWFDGFHIQTDETGVTTLTGSIADQSALYGILAKLGDLNIKLLSVRQKLSKKNQNSPQKSTP